MGDRKSPFHITLAIGLYNSLYYRTSRDLLSVVTFVRPTAKIFQYLLQVCLFQHKPPHQRAGELLGILRMRDGQLVQAFYKALAESGQPHIARMLGYEGLCYLFSFISFVQSFVRSVRKS